MVNVEEWVQIRELRRQGLSITAIARHTGHDRKTIRKVIRSEGPLTYGPRGPRPSKLEPFKPYVEARMAQGVFNTVKLLQELREQGYPGQLSILKDFVRPFRQAHRREPILRFETRPGQQAQVDWAHFGTCLVNGEPRQLSAFVMTLGYSRALYLEFTCSQALEWFLECHLHAFHFFGGLPQEILYDNLKSVVLERRPDGSVKFHPRFLDFATYYGFTPKPCWPYRAQTKGKTERAIGYVRQNFFVGLTWATLPELNQLAFRWLHETANCRVHGTTHERPAERLQRERPALLPLPAKADYETSCLAWRRSSRDGLVSYKGSLYSVPWAWAGASVLVKERPGEGCLRIYHQEILVATHPLAPRSGTQVVDPAHRPPMPVHASHKAITQVPGHGPRLAGLSPGPLAPEVEVRPLAIYEARSGGRR
jgi:transposase